jgi:hypothetical protein
MEKFIRARNELKNFLEDDRSDALNGLFVGAVVWDAVDEDS